jgi:hypothetical protein
LGRISGDLWTGGERVLESVGEEIGDGAAFFLRIVFCIFFGGGRSDDDDVLEESLELLRSLACRELE